MLLVTALVSASPLQGQRDIVVTQLDSAVVLMEQQGFSPHSDEIIGILDEGEVEEIRVALSVGSAYIVVGVCDADCSDLDLAVTDSNGDEIEADRELDDVPMLYLFPEAGMSGIITVEMATCANSCVYGVRIFQREI